MLHRSVALLAAAALAAGPLVLTATATAAPTPTAVSAADDTEATKAAIERVLAQTAERRARAQATRDTQVKEASVSPDARAAESGTESGATALAAAAETGRIFGANRYDTAVRISRVSHPDPLNDFGGLVIIANGNNFPDALAAGPAAASMFAPILLVPPTGGLPAAVADEIRRLGADSVAILGGTDNVSAVAESQLTTLVPENGVFRIAGTNRYETSALLAYFVGARVEVAPDEFEYVEPDTVIISTGLTFADALAGGAAGGWEYAPLLLTPPGGLDRSVAAELAPVPPDPQFGYSGRTFTTVRVLGSTSTISAAVVNEIRAILPTASIIRYAGTDRFDTARRLNADVFTGPVNEVTLTNGLRFPDALAGAPRVNLTLGPTVPVRTECLPAPSLATLTALNPITVTAIGNVDAVSNATLAGTRCP